MKLEITITGKFHRLLLSGTESISVSLDDLMREVQAIATQHRRRTPQLLRQSFGLNFLPEPVLINLCKQAQSIIKEKELYQVPSLQLLQPIKSQFTNQVVNKYAYKFISELADFQLTSDDIQIPIFAGIISEIIGTYTMTIDKPDYPGLNKNFAQNKWEICVNYWDNLPDIEKINLALKSRDLNNFSINYQDIKIWISIQELSLNLRAAITYLRSNQSDTANLSETVKSLFEEYQSKYILQPINLPAELRKNSSLPSNSGFSISKRENRNTLKTIINSATQFLLISSYIIEDEELTELICQKSQELPQGVWILTDLRNEVLNRIDEQVSDDVFTPAQYQRSSQRKITCLKKLLNANISIRSGAFHLKTYISETYAYLGSCNLTPKSLDFNIEAGVLYRNNSRHESLINLFREFWVKCTKDEVIPDSNGFHLRSLFYCNPQNFPNYLNFLTPSQYKRDLIESMRNFRETIKIYSWSFQPSPEIETYLRWSDTHIFIGSSMLVTHQHYNIQKIDNLHAKITILGNRIAYIGGINFNFGDLDSHDLMYRTEIPQEINKIISLLP